MFPPERRHRALSFSGFSSRLLRILLMDQLQECLNIAEGEAERLRANGVSFDVRHMVGHDHPIVTDLLIDAHGPDHIHVAIVGEGFLKVQEPPFDIAEMYVEDLAATAEVAD